MVSRRDMLKLASLFTAAGSLPLLQACQRQQASQPDAPLRIGYLPITDATPLLVAHSQGLFQAEGLEVEAPVLFRSWAQLVEAFISGQVNLVHLLTPMTVWARYGSESPLKVLMWNHMAGSALTVLPGVNSVADRVLLIGNTPGRLLAEWRLEQPYPRDDVALTMNEQRLQILQSMRNARLFQQDMHSLEYVI